MEIKIKVLHIISTPGLGGAQTLLRDIVKNSNNQYIYCLRKDKIDTFKGLERVFYYKSYNYYKFNPLVLIDLFKIIKQNNFNVLHLHLGKPLIYAYIIKIFIPSIKIFYHEHGTIFDKKTIKVYSRYLKFLGKEADLFIAVSRETKQKLTENTGISENKIKVLYNFVDLEKFNPESLKKYNRTEQREKLGMGENDFVIGFAGRLVQRKGWEEFVYSAKILLDEGLKVKFLIVGDGPDKQEVIHLICRLGLNDNVFFLGFVPDIRCFYTMIDCFVIPSHWEPMGITELEAMTAGVSVIASNVAGLNEVIKDKRNGLLFKARDKRDLAEKVRLVYSDEKLRRKLIENGLNSVKEYSLTEYLEQLNKTYNYLR